MGPVSVNGGSRWVSIYKCYIKCDNFLQIKNTYHTDNGNIENFRMEMRNLILLVPKVSSLLKPKTLNDIQGFGCKLNSVTHPYSVRQTLFLESIFEEGIF